MPPVSNVTPFADEPEHRRRRRAGRAVAHHDHARRLRAAARDAKQQAHPELRDFALAEHLHGDTGAPADFGGALGEDRRRQDVRRLVGELAGEIAGLAQDSSALDARLERRPIVVGAAGQNQDLFERGRGAFAALVAIAAERREREPFRGGLDRLREREVAPVEPCEPLHAALPGLQGRSRRDPPQPLGRELRPLAGADERNPARPPRVGHRRDEDLVRPPLDLAGLERAHQGVAGRIVQRAEIRRGIVSFENRNGNEVGLDVGRGRTTYCEGGNDSGRGHPEHYKWITVLSRSIRPDPLLLE